MNNIKELRDNFLNIYTYQWSGEALDAVEQVLDYIEHSPDKDPYEIVWEVVGETFIYFNDAFDYLKGSGHYYLKDAFDEGYGENVSSIATYFLEREVFELLSEIRVNY